MGTMGALMSVAQHFHRLAAAAGRHGGFWVSASGGTINAAAGTISHKLGIPFEDAYDALVAAGEAYWGGTEWYNAMWEAQGLPRDPEEAIERSRWDVGTVAKAAVTAVFSKNA